MGGINLTYPAGFTSGVLIADTVTASNGTKSQGSTDALSSLTKVGGNPVSACLELQSTKGALLVPRMTTTQRDLMTVTDGMIIYNLTSNTVQMRVAGVWTDEGPSGDVVGPGVSAIPDVPVFNNLTGNLLADSGIRLFGAATNNLYLGKNVGNLVSTGTDNTLLGTGAGANVTTASQNIFIGKNAGSVNLDYTQCILIGNGTETIIGNLVNAIAIGNGAQVGGSNCMVLGAAGTNVGIGQVVPNASLHVSSSPGVYGGVILPTRTITSDTVLLDFTDYVVITNESPVTNFTLPITNIGRAGQIIIVKCAQPEATAITITPQGGQQIDLGGGNATRTFANLSPATTGIGVTLQTDGVNWYILSLVGTA